MNTKMAMDGQLGMMLAIMAEQKLSNCFTHQYYIAIKIHVIPNVLVLKVCTIYNDRK